MFHVQLGRYNQKRENLWVGRWGTRGKREGESKLLDFVLFTSLSFFFPSAQPHPALVKEYWSVKPDVLKAVSSSPPPGFCVAFVIAAQL